MQKNSDHLILTLDSVFRFLIKRQQTGINGASILPAMDQQRPLGIIIFLLVLIVLLTACGGDGSSGGDAMNDDLPQSPPTEIKLVTSEGFESPGDAVASPDGSTFYFTAKTLDEESKLGIFSVSSNGGPVKFITGYPSRDPLEITVYNDRSETPGLLMSCDGNKLYSTHNNDVIDIDLDSLETSTLETDGITEPSGLAMHPDCSTLHVTGVNRAGSPAVFTLPSEGGIATETYSGGMLVSPSGIYVDSDSVSWVMDHLGLGEDGEGTLFAITIDGDINSVLSGLRMGNPAGVSLTAGGVTAVIPELDEFGNARLTSINTITGEVTELPAPEMVAPAGIRTAREAGILVVVDSEGDAIFRAR